VSSFFRYPHTPHLAWLGATTPRDDKVLSDDERQTLLARRLVVEEKVDGANVGFSVSDAGELRIQNRGSYLERGAVASQFKLIFRWADSHANTLISHLGHERILFGEWSFAVHSVRYTSLPDWFLAFDVYDRVNRQFLGSDERDTFVRKVGLQMVPRLGVGHFTLASLKSLLGTSSLGAIRGEGLVVRTVDSTLRAKLVTAEFTQAIGEHWSKRALQTNSLAGVAQP
jgi:RNA ligase